ncbi:hypothetical protein ACIOBL_19540 [Paenibacillus taichungensis]|uniref:hypothetical protein n=1 Tax=Paenibacillus taichungensis TaxID=484184 RepID=UPI003816B570
MVDKIRALCEGSIPTTATSRYVVPSGKYAVVKSIVIVNGSSIADLMFTITIGGVALSYNHTLKANDALYLNELDIPLLPGEEIILSSSTSNGRIIVTGLERDYVAQDYPYVKINASLGSSYINLPANDFDSIMKSLILCNNTGTDSRVMMSDTAGSYMLFNKLVKGNDTMLIPLPNVFVAKRRQWQLQGAGVKLSIILEKVVQ